MSGFVEDLSDSQAKALRELQGMLSEETSANEETLLRFLRARSFNVDASFKQYMKAHEWRRKNNIDQILETPNPLEQELKNIMSSSFHKADKEGRPCYIEKTGRMDVLAMMKIPTEQVMNWHIWNNERQIGRMENNSNSSGKTVETMVHIHDMSGATMLLRKAVSIFKCLVKLDQDYYPERMGKIFIVNTPWVFPVLWKIARVFVDPKTRSKCVILKHDEENKLLEYFNAEDLPVEFGGTCSCEDGCLPPVPKHMLSVDEQPVLTEKVIGAKKEFEYRVECKEKEGGSLGYFFKVSSKDVRFGIKFRARPHSGWTDDINEVEEVWVEELKNVLEYDTSITGFFTIPCPGICTLVWDNSESRWLSRTVKYHVMLSESDPDSDDDVTNGKGRNHNGSPPLQTKIHI